MKEIYIIIVVIEIIGKREFFARKREEYLLEKVRIIEGIERRVRQFDERQEKEK